VTRRTCLQAAAAGTAVGLAGCVGGLGGDDCPNGSNPQAIALSGTKQCDVCGMVISQHPGPVGQIFYCSNGPEGRDNPAYFDALNPCLFDYYFEKDDAGWEPTGIFVTDYAAVDYEVYAEGGEQYVSAHVEAEAFTDATEAWFVVGSDVKGAMKTAIVPFSEESAASSFADEYGGELYRFDEITPGMVADR
jgi:nitrous oxide reductase accessory protein NosL